ncbi:acyltransferase [Novosphingobium resinovorum]
MRIGHNAFINRNVYFDLNSHVSIGDRVYVANHVRFITTNHEIGDRNQQSPIRPAPIVVGDGAWIGANAIILPGVHIGNGSVVAAGAVVTRDVPENSLVAGVPARIVRTLPE